MKRQELEVKCKYLALVLGVEFGEYNAPGGLMLDGANGGYKLQQVCANGRGVSNLTARYAPGVFGAILDGMIIGAELAKGDK